jgi:hypothetical protein
MFRTKFQKIVELDGTYLLMVYAGDGRNYVINKKTEALIDASKEVDL